MIRVMRASCVRDVCLSGNTRGIELVKPIEEAIRDEHAGVVALVMQIVPASPPSWHASQSWSVLIECVGTQGFESLAALCGVDHLDFYGAWRVVVKIHPKLPKTPTIAAKWVSLLAHGALDALVRSGPVPVARPLADPGRHPLMAILTSCGFLLSRSTQTQRVLLSSFCGVQRGTLLHV